MRHVGEGGGFAQATKTRTNIKSKSLNPEFSISSINKP
ncbi:hypothetical protein GNIT_2828 [Glaciecola nitratireducens FR1064]|uniref:Uncharacterized protein n=1 Tax=Glaciecola nitratireducens (strain JCM 12485 / KCTC 12276 / FR1064) TaxID=1085623 RepID=G4QMH3_GLANF|nr:hypothetical protein GNIT_2828 [Glaciecola nitratireducens FR1064]